MTRKIEEYIPPIKEDGLVTDENATIGGNLAVTGNQTVGGTQLVTGVATFTAAPVFTAAPSGSYFTAQYYGGTTAAATDVCFFIAPVACTVVAASQVHAVAAGGASTLQLVKDTSTDAPGAGTDLLSAAFDLNATANTVQVGALTGTLTLAVGNRLSVDYANAIQSSAGVVVTVLLKVT